ncbi:unnamed protein product [Paramecium octaurelia]|uniref:Uncharacterized protein n=1 Tax=Paramecium octaurelia TaxID=43137 RepID=A0A8S1XTY1_PAROT|nr:unnamed protein product [Paramecium octaurelia]
MNFQRLFAEYKHFTVTKRIYEKAAIVFNLHLTIVYFQFNTLCYLTQQKLLLMRMLTKQQSECFQKRYYEILQNMCKEKNKSGLLKLEKRGLEYQKYCRFTNNKKDSQ